MLKLSPAVFTVGNSYQIMAKTEFEALVSIKINNKFYFDESNGIMNSRSPIHRVTVPMDELNNAKKYTLCIRPIKERLPYYTKTDTPLEYNFNFTPIPEDNIRIYHISDAHNRIEEPINAAKAFGKTDLLILNGDIIDHSGDPEKFTNIYSICSEITGGQIPVIFSRGNHDMRGNYAEKFAEYTPNYCGNTYYTFTIGNIWGIILDCGEDKDDSSIEYGFTVACHNFRERQTDFIKSVIKNAENEYSAPNIKTRLIISHNPFTQILPKPFDIEKDVYTEWALLLKENIKPDLMICGHTHECEINRVGCEKDNYGQPCTVVIGSKPEKDLFTGCGIIINKGKIKIVFTDSNGNTKFCEYI